MKFSKKKLSLWALILLSMALGALYVQQRDRVFPIPSNEYWLNQSVTKDDLQAILYPIVDFSGQDVEFETNAYVDQNSIKFLLKDMDRAAFEKILKEENIPLWGWEIKIKKPVRMDILITQQKRLVGLQFMPDSYPKLSTSHLFDTLVEKSGGHYQSERTPLVVPYQEYQEKKYERKIASTDLLERVTFAWVQGRLQKMTTSLLLPTTYANGVNDTIEKQKSLHQVFNVLHYILIGIVFLFLFRIHETHALTWKQSLPFFLLFLISQFFTYLFKNSFDQNMLHLLLKTTLTTLGNSLWIYLLIVVADFIARTHKKSTYSLTDITKKSFFRTVAFRKALLVGWLLAIWQIVFVFCFYKISSLLSLYIPLKIPGEDSMNSSWEFVRYFFDSLSTAIYEETLYRLFFIYFFITLLKKTLPAILLSSVIWGFLHLSYQFEPYYIRGLELSLIGILYGYVMMEYGILSVIVGHFLYNGFILSEYENQSWYYIIGVQLILSLIGLISYLFRKPANTFHFQTFDLTKINPRISVVTERRSRNPKSYPLKWRYGIFTFIALILFLIWYPVKKNGSNASIDHQKLRHISSNIVSPYIQQDQSWSVVFQKENPDIPGLKKNVQTLDPVKKTKMLEELQSYSNIWSVRYFLKPDYRVLCDLDFSHDYELLKITCRNMDDYKISSRLNFFDWVHHIKNPDETWTLANLEPHNENKVYYQYKVMNERKALLDKSVYMSFKNQQLSYFKKELSIPLSNSAFVPDAKKPHDWISIGYSIFALLIILCLVYFMMEMIKKHGLYEKKALYGSIGTFLMYLFWNLNAYKMFLSEISSLQTLRQFLFHESLIFTVKLLAVGFLSYILFFCFFYFPKRVFEQAPTSEQWNSILSRPIWKWRNTKASLFYSMLLLSIQFFLRFLIQIDGNFSNFEPFNFDISYLNHEYLIITFLGVLWKSLLFWVSIVVIASAFERYFSRWIYLPIICAALFSYTMFGEGSLDSKLIELCSTYIVFYFIYNISKFDFAFYFWFILLNSTLVFFPVLIYPQFAMYSYQVYFIYIFVASMILYTLLRNNKKLSFEANKN